MCAAVKINNKKSTKSKKKIIKTKILYTLNTPKYKKQRFDRFEFRYFYF